MTPPSNAIEAKALGRAVAEKYLDSDGFFSAKGEFKDLAHFQRYCKPLYTGDPWFLLAFQDAVKAVWYEKLEGSK